MKKITLLSSQDLDGYTTDDHILEDELRGRGFFVHIKPWETFVDEGEDIFVIRSTWNYTEYLNEFMKCLSTIENRLWNPLPLVKWNANKRYLLELREKGVKVIPMHLAHDHDSLKNAMDCLGGEDFVAKPLVDASAKGLIRFPASSPPALSKEMIIQKFHPQIINGEISLFYYSGDYAYAIRKTPKPGDIRVQEEYGGKITQYAPSQDDFLLAQNAIAQIPGKWLYARVDIVPGVGLIELECIEPSLYFSICKEGAAIFADALQKRMLP